MPTAAKDWNNRGIVWDGDITGCKGKSGYAGPVYIHDVHSDGMRTSEAPYENGMYTLRDILDDCRGFAKLVEFTNSFHSDVYGGRNWRHSDGRTWLMFVNKRGEGWKEFVRGQRNISLLHWSEIISRVTGHPFMGDTIRSASQLWKEMCVWSGQTRDELVRSHERIEDGFLYTGRTRLIEVRQVASCANGLRHLSVCEVCSSLYQGRSKTCSHRCHSARIGRMEREKKVKLVAASWASEIGRLESSYKEILG